MLVIVKTRATARQRERLSSKRRREKKDGDEADPEEWEYKFGTAPSTGIWEMGYRDLMDLQQAFRYAASSSSDFGMLIGDSPDLVK